MSAQSLPGRRRWLSALAAQVADYVLEPVDESGTGSEPAPVELKPHPVIAVASAAPRSGASTVARLLAAELAHRAEGAALVAGPTGAGRAALPSRAAVRLATALAGLARIQPNGRLCLVHAVRLGEAPDPAVDNPDAVAGARATAGARAGGHVDVDRLAAAARYLAPTVVDFPPDGSAARATALADRVVVVGSAAGERPLLDAVATIIGGDPVRVVNRAGEDHVADGALLIPESRIAARAAVMGTRPLGALGAAIATLADALEASP